MLDVSLNIMLQKESYF